MVVEGKWIVWVVFEEDFDRGEMRALKWRIIWMMKREWIWRLWDGF